MERKEKIVAFGELMLRLTPPDYTTIAQARSYIANYGGCEANVLVSLSHLGHKSEFITKLPNNQLGDSAEKHLLAHGVDTSHPRDQGLRRDRRTQDGEAHMVQEDQ